MFYFYVVRISDCGNSVENELKNDNLYWILNEPYTIHILLYI